MDNSFQLVEIDSIVILASTHFGLTELESSELRKAKNRLRSRRSYRKKIAASGRDPSKIGLGRPLKGQELSKRLSKDELRQHRRYTTRKAYRAYYNKVRAKKGLPPERLSNGGRHRLDDYEYIPDRESINIITIFPKPITSDEPIDTPAILSNPTSKTKNTCPLLPKPITTTLPKPSFSTKFTRPLLPKPTATILPKPAFSTKIVCPLLPRQSNN